MSDPSDNTVLLRHLEPLDRILTAEIAQQIVEIPVESHLKIRFNELLEKSLARVLSTEEESELHNCIVAIDCIDILQMKARSILVEQAASR